MSLLCAPARWLRRSAAVLVLALLSGVAAYASPHPENLRLRQVGVAEGLPSNRANALLQDPSGYLWIGTGDGLARYDGTAMQVLRMEDGLPTNFIWSLAWRADGTLWIGTRHNGLAVYDPVGGDMRRIDRSTLPGLGGNDIWALDTHEPDAVWIGTADAGLHRLHDDGRIERWMPEPGNPRSLPHAGVVCLERDPQGRLWVATLGGLARWTGDGFERVDGVLPTSIRFDRDGVLWVGAAEGAHVLDPDGALRPAPVAAPDPRLRPIQLLVQDQRGAHWVDVAAGLGHVDHGESHEVPLYSPLAQDRVRPQWTMGIEDREGGIWLASHTHGLWYHPAGWSLFSARTLRPGQPGGIHNSHVRGIAASSDGSIWLVGSGGALESLDLRSGRLRKHLHDVADGRLLDCVHEDRHGQVWIGSRRGLARYTPATGALQRWADADGLAGESGAVVRFAESAQGLWMLFDNGVIQLRDRDGHTLDIHQPGGGGLESGENVYDLAIGPDGAPWLATARALRHLRDGQWRQVDGAPVGGWTALRWDARAGQVLAAGAGTVAVFDWRDGRLHPQARVGAAEGLPQVAFSGVVRDAGGVLWLSSSRGLWRVDPVTAAVRAYGIADGLPSQDFPTPLFADPHSGRVFAGSPDGLVDFDPLQVVPATDEPRVLVEEIGLRGQAPIQRMSNAPFVIGHGDRELQVRVRLMSFRNPGAHRYAFHLDGEDAGWVETATGERAFSQLAPGQYTLWVRARNEEGVWSTPQALRFEVTPPWWRTLAAQLLFAAVALAAVWWIAWSYRRRLRRRHAWQLAEHKREVAEQASLAKTHFLATLGHEVRTPMTGVLGMSELLLGTPLDERQQRYAESIRDAGEHLLRLVNDALDLARIEAGKLKLDTRPFDLRALLDETLSLMAPVAHQRGLEFRERIAVELPAWVSGDVVRVRQILLNLLANAIKFTEHGHVELSAEPAGEGQVRFVVGDSGPGLNREQRERLFRRFEQAEGARTSARYGGSGLGLAICQELAAEMGGRIDVDSAPGQGTRFAVELPLPEVRPPSAEASVDPAPRPPGTLFLLLVEDDPTVAEVISGLLQAQGHRVMHVAHGLAALVSLATAEVDAALLDLDLPGIDGLALARQMRAQGFGRPLIAITARADADAEPLAMQASFDGFLRKPLTGGILADALARWAPPPAAVDDAHGQPPADGGD
ncbi:sensor histidine kinase [Luteimonas sp. MHLX1A]|uniref:sensor histidine kinase n=1 Tax=Alterluteimonas muca TaxID=2878684 RepID=UPI001E40EF80|nr:ATP-binding protein [Luteimonas sp. MHLX1A]MCD9047679.1 response regulator [Luteimonas sp. MHLX1A]